MLNRKKPISLSDYMHYNRYYSCIRWQYRLALQYKGEKNADMGNRR